MSKVLAKMILGILLLLVGLWYALAPFTFQLYPTPAFGLEELMLQMVGLLILIAGLIVAVFH